MKIAASKIVFVLALCTALAATPLLGCTSSHSSGSFSGGQSSGGTTQQNSAKSSPQSLPATGTMFKTYSGQCDSELTITASPEASSIVKLKTADKKTVLSFFVRAGETVKIPVPAGDYYIFFASGDEWYGVDESLGENTIYGMDDDILDFSNYTWTYELELQTDGNFSQKKIDAEDF